MGFACAAKGRSYRRRSHSCRLPVAKVVDVLEQLRRRWQREGRGRASLSRVGIAAIVFDAHGIEGRKGKRKKENGLPLWHAGDSESFLPVSR